MLDMHNKLVVAACRNVWATNGELGGILEIVEQSIMPMG